MPREGAQSRDIESFNRWSSTYENSLLQRYLFDRVHQVILALVAEQTEPGVILDVGCGTGRLLRAAAVRWPEAELKGVDPATGMVKMARELTPKATFYLGSGEALPFSDASIDVAWSTISFHHWQNQSAGLCEISRVLRPGGYFFLADIAIPGWIPHFIYSKRIHTPGHMRSLFTAAGLRVLVQRPILFHQVCVTVGTR